MKNQMRFGQLAAFGTSDEFASIAVIGIPLQSGANGPMRDAVENSRIVAACSNEHKAMPNRILKSQALPSMKNDTYRVDDTASCKEPEAYAWKSRCDCVKYDAPGPAQEKIKKKRQSIETTRQEQLECYTNGRSDPNRDE
jgi:hypothetical protein